MKQKYHEILKQEFKKTFPIYFLGVIFQIISILLCFKIPNIIGVILDMLLAKKETTIIMEQVYMLIMYSALVLIPYMVYRTCYFTKARISDTELRKKVIEKIQNVKPEYFEREDKASFMQYLSYELLLIRRFLGNIFHQGTKFIIIPILAMIWIASEFNIWLSLSILPIFPIVLFYIFGEYRQLKQRLEDARQTEIEYAKLIEQNSSGFMLVKLYNEQENQIKKFNHINEKMYQADYRIGIVKNRISNAMNILYSLCYCIGLGVGLFLIYQQHITIGVLTTYIFYISYAISGVVTSVNPIVNGIAYFKQAVRRFNYFFNLDSYKEEGKKIKKIENIKVNNLTYHYPESKRNVLKNINMEIQQGEKIGIIGQVGSGKTTLMNILSGFYEIPDGMLMINEIDKNQYSLQEIFYHIGYATQQNSMIDDTIRNNLCFQQESNEELQQCLMDANLQQDIEEMEQQLDTRIGERGSQISGGQKQRISIARNLLHIRDVNIFDDTLSALDNQTEEEVLNHIIDRTRGKILLVVSNKVSTMEKMDRVYVLIEGEIIAQGTPEELSQTCQEYRQLEQYEQEEEWQ